MEYISFSPQVRTYINQAYLAFRYLIVAILISSVVSIFFEELHEYSRGGHMLIGKFIPLLKFTSISLVWVVTLLIVMHNMGIDSVNILTGAGIGGAIFALASKDILSNLLGSLTIIMSRMFDIGDKIAIPQRGIEGIIEEITLNYTKIMGHDGNVAYIPNRTITNETIENMTKNRYYLYTFKLPFRRTEKKSFTETAIREVQEKIETYDPIDISIEALDPNVQDYIYKIEVRLPQEDKEFEEDMRIFLYQYIYRGGREKSDPSSTDLQN